MRKVFAHVFICLFFSVLAIGQVAVAPMRNPHVQFLDSNGTPLAGGFVCTFSAGTTTPLATYTDSTGLVQNPYCVPLDGSGSANIWFGPATYKIQLNNSSLVQQWAVDGVPGNALNNAAITGGTISGATITNSTIDSSVIGGTTPAAGTFTGITGPIGQTTPAAGAFTQIAGAVNAMTFSATPNFQANLYSIFTITLTNDVTSSTIGGSVKGQEIQFQICQDGTGGHAWAWPASFVNPPSVPKAASTCITPMFFYDGTNWNLSSQAVPTIRGQVQNVTFSATPTFDAGSYSVFNLTLTNNVTSSTVTNGVAGEMLIFNICQGSTPPGYSFAWPANFLNAPAMPTFSSGTPPCVYAQFVNDGTHWNLMNSSTFAALRGTLTYALTGNAGSAGWIKLGTWTSTGSNDSLRIEIDSGAGHTSGSNQQSTTTIIARSGDGTTAPNLSGLSSLTFGSAAVTAVKFAATNGSPAATNASWDLYVNLAANSGGTYTVHINPGQNWVDTQIVTTDPGSASTTVVVGNKYNVAYTSGGGMIQTASVAGCTTSGTAWLSCTITVTWPVAFADVNYYATCTGHNPHATSGGTPGKLFINGIGTLSTTTMTVLEGNAGSDTDISFSDVECTAVHQ